MQTSEYDVIVLGYGPVGQALALMLGKQGRSVAVCERWKSRYPLPRAVCVDHEIYRVLSANGMGKVLPAITHRGAKYEWFNAAWERLMVIDWDVESVSGGTEVNFIHQPTFEAALSREVETLPNVEAYLGWEALNATQDEDFCQLTIKDEAGESRILKGRYLVGCDGANSLVRGWMHSGQQDRGFEADWLVIDVRLKDGVTIESLGIPAAGQYCNPSRPTTIVPAGVSEGQLFRRWEFMLLPGEQIADLESEARVWELLSPWAGPDDIELIRYKVYNFRSLIADTWRRQRMLIAGDAAHVMPPFMGQGMCSGIRDAWNMTWKLGLILDGRSDERLLDSYQAERSPHVSQLIDLSIYLGKVICIPDEKLAAERDLAFRNGTAPPPPPFPHLASGLLHHLADRTIQPGAGLLSPHVSIAAGPVCGRMDDVLGPGFLLVTEGDDPSAHLPAESLRSLERLGMHFVDARAERVCDSDADEAAEGAGGTGILARFLAQRGWDAMIVRPDFYIYGGARGRQERNDLVDRFFDDLRQVGVSVEPAFARMAQ